MFFSPALETKPFESTFSTVQIAGVRDAVPVRHASTCRVSEIHTLCTELPFLLDNPLSIVLAPKAAFLPCLKRPEVVPCSDIELPAFYPELSSVLVRTSLCSSPGRCF